MKKIISLVLVLVMSMLLLIGCQDESAETNQPDANEPVVEDVVVDIFQFKVEIVEQLDALVDDFEKQYPHIDIVMDTVGGGQDYSAALRVRMNSGNQPAIFNVPGPTERDMWREFLEPLNDQDWIQYAAKGTLDNITVDGNIYGVPFGLEGYGIIYNVSMLKDAGIDTSKIDTLSELSEAFSILDEKKDELGIDVVLSYSVGASAWWTAAYHTFNIPFAMQEDPMAFIDSLNDGTGQIYSNDRFEGFFDLLDLFFEYSYEDLITVTYDAQVSNFALGKTAMLHQGNWTIGMIQEISPEIEMAFLPIPLSDNKAWGNDSIPVGVPNFWVVNSQLEPEVKEAAKKFLNFMMNTDRGHRFLVEEAQFIPAFTHVKIQPKDPLAKSIQDYVYAGRILPWVWHGFPAGFNEIDAKQAIQEYYLGKRTRSEVMIFLDEMWQEKK
ncbi:MAG: ABC transporter substrate-binding protein [Alkaliphilus sp.]|nr:MAG: ABC transporter substrate-binding protein [Alkaliphilus sp.]